MTYSSLRVLAALDNCVGPTVQGMIGVFGSIRSAPGRPQRADQPYPVMSR